MDSRERKARNWFQWTTKLLGKPKQEIIEHTTDLDANTPKNYNSLPPELVENILIRVDEHSLYACRLVNWQWNSVASKELERRNLLRWTSWDPTPSSYQQIHFPLSPTVTIIKASGILMHSRLYLPPVFSTSNKFATNPFPTNSLTIDWSHLRPSFSHALKRSMRWDKFFCQYGHFLTQVNFTRFKETLWLLKQVLIHTPNLQALSISSFGDKKGLTLATIIQLRDASGIRISPNLATLRICEDCQVYLADWLLGLCAHQLVNFFINTENEKLFLCVFRRKFEKLKLLRITSLKFSRGFCEVWDGDGASHPKLQYLFIDMDIDWYDIDIHYNIYMDFIGQFSSTLVHLHMDMAPVSRGGFGYLKEKGPIFSKVRSLTLRSGLKTVTLEGTQAKKDAEVLFPNVTDVKIFCYA
ncbi:unnamed protein product [Orchesella dallaii]|uniref:F-box domain-containing protein n=1 Tax=Orchesella dallaii TaxID=48710 RepID=A0ABP1RVT6_9HEXA